MAMSYDDFLAWSECGAHREWVDGHVVSMSPVTVRHQEVASFLERLLTTFVAVHSLGKVLSLEFQMKLQHTGREPDVLFIASANLDRLHESFLDGPADLAVEVVSPDSVKRDRQEKFNEYEQGGVREYWLIDPRLSEAQFFRLNARGSFDRVAVGRDGTFRSVVLPDFWLRVEWLWQQPLPDVNDTLLQVDRDAHGAYLRERLRQAGL